MFGRQLQRFRWKLLVVAAVGLLWLSGFTDFLFETSFDKFYWPPADKKLYPDDVFYLLPTFNNSASHLSTAKLCIVVKSAVQHFERRSAIRDTWGTYKGKQAKVETIFVIGQWRADGETTKKMWTKKEVDRYDDVLIMRSIDAYRNNTDKLISSLFWLSTRLCDFSLLVDDDYFVHVEHLLRLIEQRDPNEPIYEGFVFDTTPFRSVFSKHRVSLTDYPFDRYPRYVSAGAVLLSKRSVQMLIEQIPHVKKYQFDDIYTAILARKAGIEPMHNKKFAFWPHSYHAFDWSRYVATHGFDADSMRDTHSDLFGSLKNVKTNQTSTTRVPK